MTKEEALKAYIEAYKKGTGIKKAAEPVTDLDPDVKSESLPFNEQIKQQVHEAIKRAWTKRLIEAYKRSTGKDLKDPEKQLDPGIGYVIGHGPNIKEKILRKLHPEDAYQMSGTWTSGDNVTPTMIDDASKILRADPRWQSLEKLKGEFKNFRGPIPDITWRKPE